MRAAQGTGARRVATEDLGTGADPLAGHHCADAFEVIGPPGHTAEEWMRAITEDAPAWLRRTLQIAWRYGLGLRLGPKGSPDQVAGWPIIRVSPESITVGASSVLLGYSQLVLFVVEGRACFVSYSRFERRGARVTWALAGPIHRRVVPYILTNAARTFAV